MSEQYSAFSYEDGTNLVVLNPRPETGVHQFEETNRRRFTVSTGDAFGRIGTQTTYGTSKAATFAWQNVSQSFFESLLDFFIEKRFLFYPDKDNLSSYSLVIMSDNSLQNFSYRNGLVTFSMNLEQIHIS